MLVDYLSRVALLGSAWVLWGLLALSAVSLAAVAERLLFFRRNAAGATKLRDELAAALKANDEDRITQVLSESPSIEGRVLSAAFSWRAGGPEALQDALEAELGREKALLERSSTLLGTIGNNAPFFGLLGTVIGVIEAFHHLGAGGKQSDAVMGNVMAGIAEALIATGVGIFVALPAVIAFNVIQQRIEAVENGINSNAKLLSAWLRTRDVPASKSALHAA